jgi:hydroxylamine dehydrogenase
MSQVNLLNIGCSTEAISLSWKGNAMKMPSLLLLLAISILAVAMSPQAGLAAGCVDCHKSTSPNIVSDWQLSKHGQSGIGCEVCHGDQHTGASDASKAQIPTPDTCAMCHDAKVKQFKAGKHSFAWAAMKAMPTMHFQPSIVTDGMKGCGGCHKIGVKKADEIKELKKNNPGFGTASCDACHTRHTFSVEEARQPQACQTCHMGFDHPQWEMYSSSKHGVRYLLKQTKVLPKDTAAPTCQTCHMQDGNHEVRTAWGFLAVRLPMPDDLMWKEDRKTILQALGVLDPAGNPTKRLDVVKGAQVARLTQEDWQKERDKMSNACKQCHSGSFAKSELQKGDQMIKEADHLMAEAIRIVAGLYKDGVLTKPKNYDYAFPDVLTFNDAPTPIEMQLFVMFLEHRNRAFQGAFHNNPDYTWWYGFSELQRDLTEIKYAAEELRRNAKIPAKKAAVTAPAKKPAKQ